MQQGQELVAASRRQLIRFIAMTITVVGAIMGVLVIMLVFVLPNGASLGLYPLLLGLGVAGGGITLYLLPRLPLSSAMLPLVVALIGCVIGGALLFGETALIAASFLTVVALLVSLGQSRMIAVPIAILCVLLGLGLAATAPLPVVEAGARSLGPALPFVGMAGIGTTIGVTWLIAMRLMAISDRAVALADQRAREAEEARTDLERRALELAEQYEAQQRLIALITTLETPAVTVADGVVLLPLIGHMDTRRSLNLTARLLEAVHSGKNHLVIIDVSGIAILDTGVVQNLLHAVKAVRLLGAQVRLCGIQASMATTMVQLGVDLTGVIVTRTPQEAIAMSVESQQPAHAIA